MMSFYFPNPSNAAGSVIYQDRRIWFDTVIFLLLVTALASPYFYKNRAAHERSGRDLVLALDASGSMGESGFDKNDPDKRKFDVVIDIARNFLRHRFDDNMGLVIFGTFAFCASPVTYDLPALEQILKMMDVGIAGQNTAIGEAIAQSVRSLSFGHAKEKVIILLTDGRHNSGSISPKDAVDKAKRAKIKIYTIGIGKHGDFDDKLLKTIAKETGGKMFMAIDAKSLLKVYETIAKLEPSPLRSKDRVNRKPLYQYLLIFAMLALFGRILKESGVAA